MKQCKMQGCIKQVRARGLCGMHYMRWSTHSDPSVTKIRSRGEGTYSQSGYLYREENGVAKFEHVRIAERALGKPLPCGAVVHHADENRKNNTPTNLVICPNRGYHRLLHQRINALKACGHADWRKCKHCQQYDAVENLRLNKGGTYHLACRVGYQRKRIAKKAFNQRRSS